MEEKLKKLTAAVVTGGLEIGRAGLEFGKRVMSVANPLTREGMAVEIDLFILVAKEVAKKKEEIEEFQKEAYQIWMGELVKRAQTKKWVAEYLRDQLLAANLPGDIVENILAFYRRRGYIK